MKIKQDQVPGSQWKPGECGFPGGSPECSCDLNTKGQAQAASGRHLPRAQRIVG